MSKIYEFDGKHYCEDDISEIDDLYAGDLDDLWEQMCRSGYYREETIYCTDENVYDDVETLIDENIDVVGQVE